MKRVVASIALALVVTGAFAQDSTQVKQRVHHRMEHAKKNFADLNLTEDQKKQMAALRKEQHEKFLAILTPEQKAKLEQQKSDRKARFEAGSTARLERMKKALNLSADQTAKMKALNDKFKQEAGVIRANSTLAAAQQREQLKKLAADHRSEVNAMLTPAQQDTLRQLQQRHPKRTVR